MRRISVWLMLIFLSMACSGGAVGSVPLSQVLQVPPTAVLTSRVTKPSALSATPTRRMDSETPLATPAASVSLIDPAATPSPSATPPLTPVPLDVRLEVTQGAPEYPLVLGKDTLVRIALENADPVAQPYPVTVNRVELEIQDEEGRQLTLRKEWDAQDTVLNFFLPGHLLWAEGAITFGYRFTVRLFNGDALVGQAFTAARFLRNADLRLLLVPVMEPLSPVDFRKLARGLAIVSRDFPIRTGIAHLSLDASAGVRYQLGAPLEVPARFRDGTGPGIRIPGLRCDGPSLLWLSQQLLLLQATYNFSAPAEAQADHVVGLIPAESIAPKCSANGLAERYGLYAWVALLPEHTGKALAMEIAHNLGAVSPLATHHNPIVPYHSRNQTWYSPGLIDLPRQRFLTRAASVMFPGIVGSELDTLFEPGDYAFLSGVLHQRYLASRREELNHASKQLMLVGTLDHEDRLETLMALPLPSTAPRKPSFDSEYHLIFLNERGAILDQVGVGVSFEEWRSLVTDATHHSLISVAYPLPEETTRIELRRAGHLLAALHPGSRPPYVELPSLPEHTADGRVVIPVHVHDPDGDPVWYHLAYSVDGGQTFIPVRVGETGPEVSWPQGLRGPEREVLVRIVASDGLHTTTVTRRMRLPVGDPTPRVAIVNPLDGQTVPPDTPLPLQALTYSPIDPDLRVTWFIDNEPVVPWHTSELTTSFTPGTHRIAVVVTDVEGRQARDEIVVTVSDG